MNKYIALLFCLLIITACEDDKSHSKIVKEAEEQIERPDQLAHNIEVTFMDKGKKVALLKAGRARVFNSRSETLLDSSVYVDFFSRETGNKISTLTSDSARIDDKTKDMLALGDVLVVSDSNQTRLTTTVLEWLNKTQRLYSSEFVTINQPGRITTGHGFESDLKLENYRINKVSMIDEGGIANP